MKRKLIPAFLFIAFVVVCNTCVANNAIYEQRKNDYIDSSLIATSGHKMIFQAFRNVPVDSAQLTTMLNNIATKTTSDFDIIQLIRILYLSNGQYDSAILPVLNNIPYWVNYNDTIRNYWSENHMIMWMSCDWLLHERYNKPIDSDLRNRIVHFLDLKNTYGFYEFNSTTYNPFTLSGLLNLADFSQDTVIKNKSASAAQRLLKTMLLFTNDLGVCYPVAGRNYPGRYIEPYYQNYGGLVYLLTGKGAPDNFTTSAAFLSTSALEVDTVINSWQQQVYTTYQNGHSLDTSFILNNNMSFIDRVVFQWSFGGYFHPDVVSNTVQVLNDSALWDQTDFSLLKPLQPFINPQNAPSLAESLDEASKSTVLCDAQITLFKHNSITLSSVTDFWKGKTGFQQYTCVANVGTTAVYTGSGEVFADWEDRNSKVQNTHQPCVNQNQNVSLIMYRPEATSNLLPAYFQNKDVSLHWRQADYDETIEDSLWLIGRQADRYVAVRRSCIGQINGLWACPTTGGQTWVFVVGDSLLHGSFSNFQNVIHQSQFQEQWYYDSLSAKSVYFAAVTVDTVHVEYAWGVDSITTGINPIAPDLLNFNVYPNPAQNQITVSFANQGDMQQVNIYSITGVLLYTVTTTANEVVIPVTDLAEGMYVIACNNGKGSGRKLFSVQR